MWWNYQTDEVTDKNKDASLNILQARIDWNKINLQS